MRARITGVGLGALLLAMVAGGAGASGDDGLNEWQTHTFDAPIPCGVACPSWLAVTNVDIDGNGKQDVFFDSCESPDGTADALAGVPGLPYTDGTVFDDVVVGPAPDGTRLLEVEIAPPVDRDLFICEWLPGDVAGSELGVQTVLEETCDNWLGPNNPVPVGCVEHGIIEASPGARYMIRVYNVADVAPIEGRYRFRSG